MSLLNYIQAGGSVMYIIVIINIIGLAIVLYKSVLLLNAKKIISQTALTMKTICQKENKSPEETKKNIGKEISRYMDELDWGVNTIKIIAYIAPLLGLLGTVIGIFEAFRAMADSGMADPAKLAGGIHLALTTTVGGIIVAIPHYIAYSYFVSMLDKIESALEREAL